MKRVLLIGEGSDYREGRALLARSNLTVDHMTDLSCAMARFGDVAYDVVVLDYRDSCISIEAVLAILQAPTSASRHARFVLHVDAVDRSAARQLVGAHADHLVVERDAKPGEFDRIIAKLLEVAPRADERVGVRLRTRALAGPVTALCETMNLSRSGMLIASRCLYAPGAKVDFELDLLDDGPVCAGIGEVVRLTTCDRADRYGIALRFVYLAAGVGERLSAFLAERVAAAQVASGPATEEISRMSRSA